MGEARKALVGVTGSIAAYKAAELVRELRRRGWDAWVAMTAAAADYVGPMTFRALTGHPVPVGGFEGMEAGTYQHLELTKGLAAMVVAPCTANTLAKLAAGLADNVVTAAALSLEDGTPLLVAPAMNTRMWRAAATRENAARLAARGVAFVGPESGALGCGEVGEGRLAEVARIA
ncbi:MAG: hypothetical protein IK066_06805, partial [Kiritimatiellae bacterium]|nr:hypothetical protein [Kiritimatiellia bacterium]